MRVEDLGRWAPLSVAATVEVLSAVQFRWWFSGGLALELHVGRSWRAHDDTDVGVARRDATALLSVLEGWDIRVAAAGRLTPWTGEQLDAALHRNNLWCRRSTNGPWLLDVTISEGDDDTWVYRRDHRIRIPWADAVLGTPGGLPYLAPELQLLFKSRDRREKDEIDARQVAPELDSVRADLLRQMLPASHPWQRLLVPG
ncbi:MAG: amino acid transporter [Actinomycetota bacterium]|nr:amino acid transporter [Actinomycetota bacterium]